MRKAVGKHAGSGVGGASLIVGQGPNARELGDRGLFYLEGSERDIEERRGSRRRDGNEAIEELLSEAGERGG